jgi:hypothetical protein
MASGANSPVGLAADCERMTGYPEVIHVPE